MRRLFVHLLALLRRFVPAPPTTPPARILVIRPDHLGDLLLATPALRQLRQQHPHAQIIALVGPWSQRMWQGNPDIDALLTLPFPGFARQHDGRRRIATLLAPYGTLLRYALLLRAGRFDTALLLRDDHWWGAALALLAAIPRRVGHATPLCQPLLTHALPWHQRQHVAAQSLAVVSALGAPAPVDARPALRFVATPDEQAWAAQWFATHLAANDRLVVVHPGTGGATKHWLAERWVAVIDALAHTPQTKIVLTGGPGEQALVATIAAATSAPVLTLAGETSIGQLAALLGQAALVLGVDSGPLHLAASQATPSIHLFGPSSAERFGPWGAAQRQRVVRAGTWCSPCGVFAACPRGTNPPECMAQISVATVVAAAHDLLEL